MKHATPTRRSAPCWAEPPELVQTAKTSLSLIGCGCALFTVVSGVPIVGIAFHVKQPFTAARPISPAVASLPAQPLAPVTPSAGPHGGRQSRSDPSGDQPAQTEGEWPVKSYLYYRGGTSPFHVKRAKGDSTTWYPAILPLASAGTDAFTCKHQNARTLPQHAEAPRHGFT